ncbi:MAG: pilus assembly protein TadG-related protein [Microthrixaceae bacterium]
MQDRQRAQGDRGVAVIMTGLILVPLMMFAAFGVDLASWYSRISFLQKSADAASLAGTVWMPDFAKATSEAKASLRDNGIVDKDEGGTDDIDVVIAAGSRPNSLRVTLMDNSAQPYFSQVFGGTQSLSRSAEAEYNLPLPLGSPLNYFGGDASKTVQPAPPDVYSLDWPTGANGTGRPPAVAQVGEAQQAFGCNVGSLAAQGYGRWTNITTYNSAGFSGSTRCNYTVLFSATIGTTPIPPPDHTRRVPNSQPCRVRADGNPVGAVVGSWTGSVFTAGNSGSGAPCAWNNVTSTSVPPVSYYNGGTGTVPVNRPCNVGYEASLGSWAAGGGGAYQPATFFTAASTAGNRLCRWPAAITATPQPAPPNPIAANRNPLFWARISGPGGVAAQGEAYATRCTFQANTCSAGNRNTMYRDTGYWYVVKIKATGAASTQIRILDANYNRTGTAPTIGDSSDDGVDFNVSYRVFKQNNPLDFTDRTPTAGQPGAGNATPNSCWWDLAPSTANNTTFGAKWQTLCTLNPSNSDIYLVNVQTTSPSGNGAGLNAYALEAISSACGVDEACQPSVYAFGDMGMYNNPTSGLSTFYLAEVGPQYAGKTLVIELWDSGDANGIARMTPMMPSPLAFKPVVPVPNTSCSYGADTPNPRHTGPPLGGSTNAAVAPGTVPAGPNCTILTSNQPSAGGTPRVTVFNDEWLTIKVDIPVAYSCQVGVNPENTVNSCWWGIQYDFSAAATDATTWRARIEGNPVHLTQ